MTALTAMRRLALPGARARAARAMILAVVAAAVPIAAPARADDPASVLVKTQPARQGSIPDMLEAYGTAGPKTGSTLTLSLQQEGRVTGISVAPGQLVRQGDALLEFGPSAAAESAYRQAETALALARTQRANAAQLLSQQLATRDQLAQADKALLDAQTALDALRQEGAGGGVRNVSAPFDATVTAIPVARGDRVAANAPLVTLARLDGLVATVGIEPADRLRVKPGQPATLVRLRQGQGQGQGPAANTDTIAGTVLRVDAVLNPRTRLVDVDVTLPVDAALSGEAFRAAIRVGDIQGWLVQRTAVLVDGQGSYLFQVAAAKAQRIDVAIAGSTTDLDVVRGSLDPRNAVVVEGANQLADGAAVREADAPAPQEPGR